MRVDLALKYLCLAKSRSSVKTLCDQEAVAVNNRPAKPSTTLHVDDEVAIQYPSHTLTIKIQQIPDKQLSKAAAPSYYRVIGDVDETA